MTTAQPSTAVAPTRVALDLLGGDGGPGVVLDAALRLADLAQSSTGSQHHASVPPVELVLVGPPQVAADLLEARGVRGRFPVVPASSAVRMDEDAVRAVRDRPDCSVRVAVGLVRSGAVDAMVSIGHSGAALTAATLGLHRLPGISRPAVTVLVPTATGRVVLLDAGATPDATPAMLAQFARVGAAYAVALGIAAPRVGLLTIGTEFGKGDKLRRAAAHLLQALPLDYVGGVESGAIVRGDVVDVIVTDGFTGNVVLKAIEAAADVGLERAAEVYTDPRPAQDLAATLRAGAHSGALLLGVDGVCVVGHGASTADEIAAYIELAARTAADGVVARIATGLSEAVAADGVRTVSGTTR